VYAHDRHILKRNSLETPETDKPQTLGDSTPRFRTSLPCATCRGHSQVAVPVVLQEATLVPSGRGHIQRIF
jgi:hypothetical protein